MGRDWKFGYVQTRDVREHGIAERPEGLWVGTEFGTTHHDPV